MDTMAITDLTDLTDIEAAISAVDAALDERLSAHRAAHSRSVAAEAERLCADHGVDPRRGRLAGLAHDLCKQLPVSVQWEYAARLAAILPGYSLDSLREEESAIADKVVHGPASATMLAEEFGVEDASLLRAVATHSLGEIGMDDLGAILYIADKTEPGRGAEDRLAAPRAASLALILFMVSAASIRWLEGRGMAVARRSLDLYNALHMEQTRK